MQNSTTTDLSYWTLLAKLMAGLLAITAITTIAVGAFNPLLWIVVITPIAALVYAYKHCD